MIVSGNNNFLNMDLAKGKRRSQMPSIQVSTRASHSQDFLLNTKARYQTQLKDDKVLLPPQEFKHWASKLDKLKQVVRCTNPSELQIHSSKFTMSKRQKHQSVDMTSAEQNYGLDLHQDETDGKVEEEVVSSILRDDDQESLVSGTESNSELALHRQQELDGIKGISGMVITETQHESTQNLDSQAISQTDNENHTKTLPKLSQLTSQPADVRQDFLLDHLIHQRSDYIEGQIGDKKPESKDQNNQNDVNIDDSKVVLVPEESCLGYIYPKKVDISNQAQTMKYGSSLGGKHNKFSSEAEAQGNRHGNNKASSLEYFMNENQQKILTRYGKTIGYSNVPYPKSIFVERHEQQRENSSKLTSFQSSPKAQSDSHNNDMQTVRKGGASGQQSATAVTVVNSDYEEIASAKCKDILVKEQTLGTKPASTESKEDVTPKISEGISSFVGWDNANNNGNQSAVEKTRVGGVTFVVNSNVDVGPSSKETLHEVDAQISSERHEAKLASNQSRRKMKIKNMSQPIIKKRKRRQFDSKKSSPHGQSLNAIKESSAATQPSQEKPLQLANLAVLMSNLEKTGNFQQANEQVSKMNELKKRKYSLGTGKDTSVSQKNRLQQMQQQWQIQQQPTTYQSSSLKQNYEDSQHSFAMIDQKMKNGNNYEEQNFTDERGNLLKMSRDSMFEISNDQYFKNQRMVPKLTSGQQQLIQQQKQQNNNNHQSNPLQSVDSLITRKTKTSKRDKVVLPLRVNTSLSLNSSTQEGPPKETDKSQLANRYNVSSQNMDGGDSAAQSAATNFMMLLNQSSSLQVNQYQAHRLDDQNFYTLDSQQNHQQQQLLLQNKNQPGSEQTFLIQEQIGQNHLLRTLKTQELWQTYEPHLHGHSTIEADMLQIQGGQATISAKEIRQKHHNWKASRVSVHDQGKNSNKDLHVIDPDLTISQPHRKMAYYKTRPSEDGSNGFHSHQQQEQQQLLTQQTMPQQQQHMTEEDYRARQMQNHGIAQQQQLAISHQLSHQQQEPQLREVKLLNGSQAQLNSRPGTENNQKWVQFHDYDHKPEQNQLNTVSQERDNDQAYRVMNFGAGDSNNFTLGREVITTGGGQNNGGRTNSSDGESRAQSRPNDSRGSNNLPSMLQNMKSQLANNQQNTAINRIHEVETVNYGIVGTTLSPGLNNNPRKKLKNRLKTKDQSVQSVQSSEDSCNNNNNKVLPLGQQQISSTTPPYPVVNASGNIQLVKPPLIEVKTDSIKTPIPFRNNSPTTQQDKRAQQMKKQQRKLVGQRRSSKSKDQIIRFDDEDDYDAGEVTTILGDQSAKALGLKNLSDGKSRDRNNIGNDTMKLEEASSREQLTMMMVLPTESVVDRKSEQLHAANSSRQTQQQLQENSFEAPQTQQVQDGVSSIALVHRSKPASSKGTEDINAQRKPIQVKQKSTLLLQENNEYQMTQQASNLTVTQEDSTPVQPLQSKIINLNQSSARKTRSITRNVDLDGHLLIKEVIAQTGGLIIEPRDVVLVQTDDFKDLNLQQLDINSSMLINMEKKTKKKTKYQKHLVEQKAAKVQNLRFNSTSISSVNIGATEESGNQDQTHQDANLQQQFQQPPQFFLPTMPFKQSNFARTQKAIQRLRQQPLVSLSTNGNPNFIENGGARHHNNQFQQQPLRQSQNDDLSGQFINVNDYAAIHGHYAKGDSRMYLKPKNQQQQAQPALGQQIQHQQYNSTDYKQHTMVMFSSEKSQHRQSSDSNVKVKSQSTSPAGVNGSSGQVDFATASQTAHGKKMTSMGAVGRISSDYATATTSIATGLKDKTKTIITTSNINQITNSLQTFSSDYAPLQPNGGGGIMVVDTPNSKKQTPNQAGSQQMLQFKKRSNSSGIDLQQLSKDSREESLGRLISEQKNNGVVKEQSEESKKRTSNRQVIVHKLTSMPISKNTNSSTIHFGMRKSTMEQTIAGRNKIIIPDILAAAAAEKPTDVLAATQEAGPSQKNNNSSNRVVDEPSIVSQFSQDNFYNSANHLAKSGAIFNTRAQNTRKSQKNVSKMRQLQPSLVNVGLGGSTVENQQNMTQHLSNQSNYMTSTAGKFMSNNEAKQRQFIEKQRKRTASLGTKRALNNSQQAYYRGGVGGDGVFSQEKNKASIVDLGQSLAISRSPQKESAPAQDQSIVEENKAVAVNTNLLSRKEQNAAAEASGSLFISPPIIDFNGEILNDQGLLIKQALIVNKALAQPPLQQQSKYSSQQQSKQQSSSNKKQQQQQLIKQDSTSPKQQQPKQMTALQQQQQMTTQQRNLAMNALTGSLNQQPFSGTMMRRSIQNTENSVEDDQLSMLILGNLKPKDSLAPMINIPNRKKPETPVDERYGDYLRGTNTNNLSEEVNSAVRAKTPILTASSGVKKNIIKSSQMVKQAARFKQQINTMSNDTLKIVRQQMTSEGNMSQMNK